MPKAGAAATSTQRVGWDSNGVVVLNQDVSGGKTTTLSASDAKALHDQAEAELKRFTKKH